MEFNFYCHMHKKNGTRMLSERVECADWDEALEQAEDYATVYQCCVKYYDADFGDVDAQFVFENAITKG